MTKMEMVNQRVLEIMGIAKLADEKELRSCLTAAFQAVYNQGVKDAERSNFTPVQDEHGFYWCEDERRI